MPIIRVITENGEVPQYALGDNVGNSGADVRAHLHEPVVIPPLGRVAIPTGLKFEIPVGYEVQVRPRSGLALIHGIAVLNSPGTIDSSYRGEVRVILWNLSMDEFIVNDGDKIAQLVCASTIPMEFEVVESLGKTERGEGGFGHTGI